jgi:hypothetical protein
MTQNIKKIGLWNNNPKQRNRVPLVKIEFHYPCEWTVLNIEELKEIIRQWIKGEEIAYPREKGFIGREMLFDEIKEVFNEGIEMD